MKVQKPKNARVIWKQTDEGVVVRQYFWKQTLHLETNIFIKVEIVPSFLKNVLRLKSFKYI